MRKLSFKEEISFSLDLRTHLYLGHCSSAMLYNIIFCRENRLVTPGISIYSFIRINLGV